ncbi:MAG TPA: GntR family transcriptional regulator [Bordetella sp.]
MDWLFNPIAENEFEELRNTSLGKLVRDQLLGQIMSGVFTPGQALREADLVDRLKVSRVPVREALRELESVGLVVSRKHSGVYVRELSDTEVRDLYQFRALLDSNAGRAVAQLPAPRRDELARALDAQTQVMDNAIRERNPQAYYRANLQFHWLTIDYAGNKEIAKAYRELIQKLHLARLKGLSDQAHREQSNAEHKRIVRALREVAASADAQRLAGLLADHVHNAYERLSDME